MPANGGLRMLAALPMALASFILVLVVAAAGCSFLLRWSGMGSGARVLGGVMAGIVLGPTIFGAVAPEQFRKIVAGGAEQWDERRMLVRRHGADMLALERALADPEQAAQLKREHVADLAKADRRLEQAQREHQRPIRTIAIAIAWLVLLGGGLVAIATRDERQRWASPISIGAWAAAFPGALGYVAARWWWEYSIEESVMVAAALAIGPWSLTQVDRQVADQAEFGGARMVQTAGRIATIMAMMIIIGVAFGQASPVRFIMIIAAAATVLGWLIGRTSIAARRAQTIHAVYDRVLIPALAGCVMVRINLMEAATLWPILIVAILSGDGRWIGGLIGALLPGGRPVLRTMRLVLGTMAAGPTQLSITALALHTQMLTQEGALALVTGICLVELSTPLRRELSNRLAELDEELSQE